MSVTLEQYQASQAQINKLRDQLSELNGNIAKLEGEVNILNVKCKAFERQLAKKVSENKDLIALLQKQQKQKLSLLSKDRELTYNQSRGEMEVRRNQNLIKSLNQQLQKLKGDNASQKTKWLSQKQQMSNKLLIFEQKYKACKNMEEIIGLLKNSLSVTSKENEQLKAEVEELKKKINTGGSIYQITNTNKNEFIDELIKDFQEKLNAKQRTMSELRESYEKKIAELNLTIALSQSKNQKY